MSFLEVRQLSIRLGAFFLDDVSLSLGSDEYLAVIGPTGAGKTILLECIIGFYQPDAGSIFLEGRDITHDRPEDRRIGIVYQDYALLPNLNVFANIAYGLKKQLRDKAEVKQKVLEMAESLHISHILTRHPETLSGGEQQRVALARSLVVEPKLLLMDEPLSALDPRTRREIRTLLRTIIARTHTSIIHITHDLDDAWALADKVAFFSGGQLRQMGSLEDIFHRPATSQIADFVGVSRFPGKVVDSDDNGSVIRVDELILHSVDPAPIGSNVYVALRPEAVRVYLREPRPCEGGTTLFCKLTGMETECNMHHLVFQAGKTQIPVLMTTNALTKLEPHVDDTFFVQLDGEAVRLCQEI